jgi:DivIVA domain-containing protein
MDRDESTSAGSGGQGEKRLTPADVQQKEFRVSFRGYNERDVDEFLDLVTEELQRYETELMRVRSERASLDPSSFDVDDEARRILDDARARADAIVRDAEARAAGIPTAAVADTRAVVAPYLNREREFLQSLGSLVQEHANTIKTMVEEARRRTEKASSSAATEDTAGVGEGVAAEAAPVEAPAVAASSTEALSIEASFVEARSVDAPSGDAPSVGAAETLSNERESPEPSNESGTSRDEVIVLGPEEPTAASNDAPPDEREREPEGARSLRELFWGED